MWQDIDIINVQLFASSALASANILMWSNELKRKTSVVPTQLHILKLADLFSARLLFPYDSEMTVLNILASSGSSWKQKENPAQKLPLSVQQIILGIPQVGAKFFNDTKLEKHAGSQV